MSTCSCATCPQGATAGAVIPCTTLTAQTGATPPASACCYGCSDGTLAYCAPGAGHSLSVPLLVGGLVASVLLVAALNSPRGPDPRRR